VVFWEHLGERGVANSRDDSFNSDGTNRFGHTSGFIDVKGNGNYQQISSEDYWAKYGGDKEFRPSFSTNNPNADRQHVVGRIKPGEATPVTSQVKSPAPNVIPQQSASTTGNIAPVSPTTSVLEKALDVAIDFTPFFGSGRDLYKGIQSGDALLVAMGTGGLLLDAFTFGGGSLLKGGLKAAFKSLAKEGAEVAIKQDAYKGVKEFSKFLKEQGVERARRVEWIQSFQIETITKQTADNSTFGLRFFDNKNAFSKGRYLFQTFTNDINRIGLALPQKWNKMTNFTQWQIKEGSTYFMGRAASQGGRFTGGAWQMFIYDTKNLIR